MYHFFKYFFIFPLSLDITIIIPLYLNIFFLNAGISTDIGLRMPDLYLYF